MRHILLASRRFTFGASVSAIGLSIMLLFAPAVAAAPRSAHSAPSQASQATGGAPTGENNDGLTYGQQTHFGKSHLVQDPQWYAAKVARRDHLLQGSSGSQAGTIGFSVIGGAPTSYNLSTYVTGNTFEQLGNAPGGGTTPDASGHLYTDGYFWNFCGEGATTVALGYWNTIVPINQKGSYTNTDPHTTTSWDDTYNRAYIFYLGDEVKPPSFGSYGEFAYGSYPSGTTYTTDLRDTLNWEASREGALGSWSNYYYGIVWASNLSQSSLMADFESDIGIDHKADVVDVNTAYLPSWAGTNKALSHYVAVTGYNSSNNTLTYIDTCGTGCGSKGNGVYTVTLSQLYSGIENNNGNGSLVW